MTFDLCHGRCNTWGYFFFNSTEICVTLVNTNAMLMSSDLGLHCLPRISICTNYVLVQVEKKSHCVSHFMAKYSWGCRAEIIFVLSNIYMGSIVYENFKGWRV